jgi:AcrR family transcriptional regulator
MTEIDPIQAQLIAARRNQILDAATKVFAEKGFHRATIKDVAKAAGIADGTIYNYFENKTALILGLLERLNESEQRGVDFEQAIKGDIREWTRNYIKHRYETLNAQGFEMFRVLLSEVLVDEDLREPYAKQIIAPTYELAAKFFQQWADQGAIKQIDPALTMRILSATFLGLLVLRLLGDTELQNRWDELPDLVADIVLNGLIPGGNNE